MTGGILAICAHPDDLEIFAGGTLILSRRAGRPVGAVIATDGAAGHPALPPRELAAVRRREATEAARKLGAAITFLDGPDGRLVPGLDLRDRLVQAIREAAPAVVLTHAPHDYHPDHRVVSAETCAAAVLSHHAGKGETHPQPEVVFLDTYAGLGFEPEFYVDISSVEDEKYALLSCHASQVEAFRMRGGDLVAGVRIQTAFRGMQCGAAAAEGFARWKSAGSIKPGAVLLP